MKKLLLASFFIFALTINFFTTVCYASVPINNSLAPILQKVLPAVVNIHAVSKITDINVLEQLEKRRQQNQQNGTNQTPVPNTVETVSSGVIVDANNGYILTNAHAVADAQTVTVTLADGHHYNAKTIGLDKSSDIALLQIKGKNLTSIPLGDSSKLQVGDFVAAIGNPFGLSQTVTSGIVSAKDRTTLGIERYENFIQTDASINPGNSGGALINMKGELIGINTAILAPSNGSVGIGFAIPANMAKAVMLQLIQYGSVQRGALGITAQDITPELANALHLSSTSGAVISEVFPGSSAQQTGLQAGDILTAVNGMDVHNANDVVTTIGFLRVDSKVTLSILRGGKSLTITAVLEDPKKVSLSLENADPFFYGVGLKNFNQLNPIHGLVQGVAVTDVAEDTNAWHADLHPGDVIIWANQQRVKNMDDLKNITAQSSNELLLNVLRGPGAVFLVISKES